MTEQKTQVLPEDTPEWGLKLLEIMQSIQKDISAVTVKVDKTETTVNTNKNNIKSVEKKLAKVEAVNKDLHKENTELKEK